MGEDGALGGHIKLVVFMVAGASFAVPLPTVHRVVMATEVVPVPGAPSVVVGVIDFHGEVLPVLDVRQRLHAEARPLDISSQFIIVTTNSRKLGLLVDHTVGVVERDWADIGALAPAAAGLEYFDGTTRLDDGLVLIHDVDRLLSAGEADGLDAAMEVER